MKEERQKRREEKRKEVKEEKEKNKKRDQLIRNINRDLRSKRIQRNSIQTNIIIIIATHNKTLERLQNEVLSLKKDEEDLIKALEMLYANQHDSKNKK